MTLTPQDVENAVTLALAERNSVIEGKVLRISALIATASAAAELATQSDHRQAGAIPHIVQEKLSLALAELREL